MIVVLELCQHGILLKVLFRMYVSGRIGGGAKMEKGDMSEGIGRGSKVSAEAVLKDLI